MKSRNTYQETDNDNDFWISYTDLITGFLIIFIIIALYLSQKNSTKTNYVQQIDSLEEVIRIKIKEYEVSQKQYENINQVESALNLLKKSDFFTYNAECDRFELKTQVLFPSLVSDIPEQSKQELEEAGTKLQEIIKKLEKIENIGVKIIIEGRAAREERNQTDGGKVLSYKRALSLYELWFKYDNLQLGKNTEVFISGSGFEGKCRYEGKEEGYNKKFIVQIVPYLKQK